MSFATPKPDNGQTEVDEAKIIFLLRRMGEQRAMLDAAMPGGGRALLSSVLDVDEKRRLLVLDTTPDPSVERMALALPNIAFSARVDRVDVRFVTGPLTKIIWEGLPAYQASIPNQLRHLQRREYFRVEVPAAHPAYCQLLVPPRDDRGSRDLKTRVYDISAGGLSLFVPPGEDAVLTGGARFSACRLTLPEAHPILVSLRVRRNFRSVRRGGASNTCAGCEYLDLLPQAQTTIQRYLMRLDRERIAREQKR